MELPGFSAFETIFTAALTAFITSLMIPMYWTPYVNFKQELIMTHRYLQLHSNIFYNKSQRDLIKPEFEKEIEDAKYNIRTSWADLESKYLLMPSLVRFIFIKLRKLPTKKEMEDISGELLSISNSIIVFDEANSQLAESDFQRRTKSIDKVKKFIMKYGIS